MKSATLGFMRLSSFLIALGVGQLADAALITSNPGLPPDTGAYTTPGVFALYPAGVYPEVVLTSSSLGGFFDIMIIPLPGGDELEEAGSFLDGNATVGGTPVGPFSLQGPVQIITQGKTGNTTGTFLTQMISMSLTGNIGGFPVQIRESPTLASTGLTTITDIGGGLFEIDSFFDVFTEISIDLGGGFGPFVPATSPATSTLVPEPGSTALLALGLLSMGFVRRRR